MYHLDRLAIASLIHLVHWIPQAKPSEVVTDLYFVLVMVYFEGP